MTSRRRYGQEDGATAIVVTILMAVLIGLLALVVDIGILRLDRRDNQRAADMSASAASYNLAMGSPLEACQQAFAYIVANEPSASGTIPTDPCATWPTTATPCPATSLVALGAAGDLLIEVTWPVADGDPLLEGRSQSSDGTPCQRIGVSVRQERELAFSRVYGDGQYASTADAVGRGDSGDPGQIVSLVLLDEAGCRALVARGNGNVWVREVENLATGEIRPGMITVDSDATECSAVNAIEAEGASSWIRAGGEVGDTDKTDDLGAIFGYALQAGNAGHAYHQADVDAERLTPTPIGGDRITRAPIDDRYLAAVQSLRSSIIGGSHTSWQHFTTCTIDKVEPPLVGNVWIDCPSGLTINNKGVLTITGGNIVSSGPMTIKGTLSIDDGISDPHWLMVREGDFRTEGGGSVVILDHVSLIMGDEASDTGAVYFQGSPEILRWVAPDSGPLDDLAMWAETTANNRLAGQAGMILEGVWFAPNSGRRGCDTDTESLCAFEFAGGDKSSTTVYQTKAQFITWRFDVSGNGTLLMEPDPNRAVPVPVPTIGLIR